MNELIKIKDVSTKYGITARTLRYYEDIGLLTSTRIEDYAHRVYDETAIIRLKQILILRKMNISIKDIQQIFEASSSQVVLDMLDKKVDNIDDEIALLHELKEIIMNFISQIKNADFNNDSDVKLLYDKAKEIETQLITSDYIGNGTKITNINLNEMIPVYEEYEPEGAQTGKYSLTNQGELIISSVGWDDLDYIGLQTKENFMLPLRMELVAKSDGDIWLHYNKGGLCLNHNNYGTDLYYIHANDIFTGQHTSYSVPALPLDEYTEVSWVLDYNEAIIYLNGEHYHTHVWLDSEISLDERKKICSPVDVMAGAGNTVTVKSLKVIGIKSASSELSTSGIRLMEVTEKLDKKIPDVLVIKIPKFLALTSQYQHYDELWEDDGSFKIGSLPDWMNENSHLKKTIIFDCTDFLCKRKDGWWRFIHHVNEQVKNVDITPYEVIEFEGGLYAVAIFVDNETDMEYAEKVIIKWLESTKFIYDNERDVIENMPYVECDEISKGLGYEQLLRYIPIKLKEGI